MAQEGDGASTANLAADRPKSQTVKPLRALWPFLRPYRWRVLGAFVALICAATFTLLVPIAARRVVDLGFLADNVGYVDQYFGAMLGVAAALGAATAARYYLVTWLGERLVADLRASVYDHVITMSPGFFEDIRTGETLSRLTTDTTVIQSVVGATISVALRNVLLLVGGLVMMLITSPALTGAALLIVPLVVAPIVVLGRRVRALSRESQDRIADSAALAGETLQAVSTVQAFTYEPEAQRKFGAAVEAAFDAAKRRITNRAAMSAIVIFLAFSAIVGVLWLGARNVASGAMTAGELVQFLLFAVFVAGSVGSLSEVWGELQRAAGATERLVELIEARSPIAPPAHPKPPVSPARGEISFENVAFSYPSRPQERALEGVSFKVKPGETVALVGLSGAGKTTILQLLLRFYDPRSGVLRLDGRDLQEMAPSAMRQRFALVPQEPAIFAASAADNIAFGRPGATRQEIEQAAKAAAAHQFISALPQGYDTYVGERGVMLSGGQKQRIAIARAILRDAPVLLLDEATSALDAQSERLVQQAFETLSQGRTTLVVAHRLATVKRADRILVLDGGRVVADGPHDQLVAQGGLYAKLAKLQFVA